MRESGFSRGLEEAWGSGEKEQARDSDEKEQAGVKVDPAEVGTSKAAHFLTISIRRYVSCQVEIEQVPQEWDQ